jgi:hypothetical protein
MNSEGWTIERVLKTGLAMEEGANKLYMNAIGIVKDPGSKQIGIGERKRGVSSISS